MQELTREILIQSKWKVTPEQSRRLQEKALELGFNWYANKSDIEHTEHPFLFFSQYDNWNITFGDSNYASKFEAKTYEERKFEDYFEEMVMDHVPRVKIQNSDPVVPEEEKIDENSLGVIPAIKINKAHKEGDVTVIDEFEVMNLSTVPHPDPICKIQEEAAIKEFAKKHIQINIVDKDKLDVIFKYPKGLFMWAYEAAKSGQEVVWVNDHEEVFETYWDQDYEKLMWKTKTCSDEDRVTLNRNTANGWKIKEEKKSLSDYIILHSVHYDTGDKFSAARVKESVAKLKPIIDNYVVMGVDKVAAWQEIKEIFGERVI